MVLRLMVVDDEAEVLRLVKAIVEPMGYELHAFQDSRVAARALESEQFDLIFVDVRMPGLDGFELTKLIRTSQRNATVPVVMVTGLDDVETMRAGFKAGISLFLGKPFTQDRLLRLLNAVRGAMVRERRSHTRLPFHTVVTCRAGGKQFKASSLNIGENGILLDASGGLEVGQELDMEFMLPDIPELRKLRGRIVRAESPDRVGVQFADVATEDREAIRRYIFG
jgi:CheY-like chemotaxis protein